MQKQIWEITEEDIKNYPVWVFPMSEDEDSDEATIVPADNEDISNPNSQLIIQSEAIDSKGNKWLGFIYWSKPVCIEHCQPTVWVRENSIQFWFGIQKPDIQELPKLDFPFIVKSIQVGSLESIELEIKGYEYINGSNNETIS